MTRFQNSKYDLDKPAHLKIPRDMYAKLVLVAGEKKHWSELTRDIIDNWLNVRGFIE